MESNIKNFAYALLLRYAMAFLYVILLITVVAETYAITLILAVLIMILAIVQVVFDWEFILGEIRNGKK